MKISMGLLAMSNTIVMLWSITLKLKKLSFHLMNMDKWKRKKHWKSNFQILMRKIMIFRVNMKKLYMVSHSKMKNFKPHADRIVDSDEPRNCRKCLIFIQVWIWNLSFCHDIPCIRYQEKRKTCLDFYWWKICHLVWWNSLGFRNEIRHGNKKSQRHYKLCKNHAYKWKFTNICPFEMDHI